MADLLDTLKEMNEKDKLGTSIDLGKGLKPLKEFRISYTNPEAYVGDMGCIVETENVGAFYDEIFEQLKDAGYWVDPNSQQQSSRSGYFFIDEGDKDINFPDFKVYVDSIEISGWASEEHVQRLLGIVEDNSYTSEVELCCSTTVYNTTDDEYMRVLKDAEPKIQEWLDSYKQTNGRRSAGAPEAFNRSLGLKRVSCSHLSFKDSVALSFIQSLMQRPKEG